MLGGIYVAMNIEPLLHNAAIVTTTSINILVLVFSLMAYCRTRMKTFVFLVGGCAIAIFLIAASNFGKPSPNLNPDGYREYMNLYYVATIVSVGMSGLGILLLIRHILRMFERKTPPNSEPGCKS